MELLLFVYLFQAVSELYVEGSVSFYVLQVVSRWTGIPVTRLGQNEKSRLLGCFDWCVSHQINTIAVGPAASVDSDRVHNRHKNDARIFKSIVDLCDIEIIACKFLRIELYT